ncbi:MAG: heavy-metal-associated domain-containing protein [Pseudomonadota bacterium]
MEKVTLNVTGMKCGGCETNVREKLTAVNGVTEVSASHKDNIVTVDYDPEKTSIQVITNIITNAGFTVI